MKSKALEGGCFCGAIRYQVSATPAMVAYCHCADCRRSGGSVVSVLAGFPREGHALLQGDPRYHEDQQGIRRGFCGDCGTSLYYQNPNFPENLYLHIGSFDEPEALPPDRHTWLSQRVSWHRVDDEFARYDGLSNNNQAGNTPPYRDPRTTSPGTRD
jgi:hypothetical protein